MTKTEQSREALTNLLWSEVPKDQARGSLRNVLSNLNKLLPHYLIITREKVAFNVDQPFWLDVELFERQTKRANAFQPADSNQRETYQPTSHQMRGSSVLRQSMGSSQYLTHMGSSQDFPHSIDLPTLDAAVELYQGDFLSDFHVNDAPIFEEWMVAEREYWRKIAQEILQILADAYFAERQYADASRILRRILTLEPWYEGAHRQLMVTLSRMGNFNGALAQFELCQQILTDELDVEPLPETIALYELIQTARQSNFPSLPPDGTPFIGRKRELMQLHTMLNDPTCRLVTIVGLGGIGKTRLALAAARQANIEQALLFLHGIVFVSFMGVQRRENIPHVFAEALNLALAGPNPPLQQLTTYLKNKEILFVVDNFEQFTGPQSHSEQMRARLSESLSKREHSEQRTEAKQKIGEREAQNGIDVLLLILEAAPNVKLLVTSREPLGVAQERSLNLDGLAYPPEEVSLANADSLSEWARFDALELFVQTASQIQPTFQLTNVVAPHVVRLCQLVGGIPLAIKLAAVWLRAIPCEQIVAEVEHNLDVLATKMRDIPLRQRSMRAVFDYTWDLLTDEEQQGFASTSVFHDGFNTSAAVEIAQTTEKTLMALVHYGLLQSNVPQKQSDSDFSERIRDKAFPESRYTIHELTRQYAWERLDAINRIDEMRENHAAYYAHFIDEKGKSLRGAALASTVQELRQEMSNIGAAWQTDIEQKTIERLQKMTHGLGRFFGVDGQHMIGIDRFYRAIPMLEEQTRSVSLSQPQGREIRTLLATLYGWIGKYHLPQRLVAEAEYFYYEQFKLAKDLNDPINLATSQVGLALVAIEQGRFAEAGEQATAALALFRQADHDYGTIDALYALGISYMTRDFTQEAIAAYQEAVEIGKRINDEPTALACLINLGLMATDVGNYETAKEYYDESFHILAHTTLKGELGRLSYQRGRLAAFAGDYDDALVYLQRAREVALDMGNHYIQGAADRWIGRVHQQLGDLDRARRVIQRALTIHQQIEHLSSIGIDTTYLALTEEAAGHYELARDLLTEAIAYENESNRLFAVRFCRALLGRVLIRLGELEEAKRVLSHCLSEANEQASARETLALLAIVADYQIAIGQVEEALLTLLFVVQHPATSAEFRAYAQGLMDRLDSLLSEEVLQETKEAVHTITLDELLNRYEHLAR
ncbi:tetratricopeptide repeat protein [Chloroflexi bacterium TSY]|nr:tetratricopeptide repeat protein [Chloroflexi bacterium TSY]